MSKNTDGWTDSAARLGTDGTNNIEMRPRRSRRAPDLPVDDKYGAKTGTHRDAVKSRAFRALQPLAAMLES